MEGEFFCARKRTAESRMRVMSEALAQQRRGAAGCGGVCRRNEKRDARMQSLIEYQIQVCTVRCSAAYGAQFPDSEISVAHDRQTGCTNSGHASACEGTRRAAVQGRAHCA